MKRLAVRRQREAEKARNGHAKGHLQTVETAAAQVTAAEWEAAAVAAAAVALGQEAAVLVITARAVEQPAMQRKESRLPNLQRAAGVKAAEAADAGAAAAAGQGVAVWEVAAAAADATAATIAAKVAAAK